MSSARLPANFFGPGVTTVLHRNPICRTSGEETPTTRGSEKWDQVTLIRAVRIAVFEVLVSPSIVRPLP